MAGLSAFEASVVNAGLGFAHSRVVAKVGSTLEDGALFIGSLVGLVGGPNKPKLEKLKADFKELEKSAPAAKALVKTLGEAKAALTAMGGRLPIARTHTSGESSLPSIGVLAYAVTLRRPSNRRPPALTSTTTLLISDHEPTQGPRRAPWNAHWVCIAYLMSMPRSCTSRHAARRIVYGGPNVFFSLRLRLETGVACGFPRSRREASGVITW